MYTIEELELLIEQIEIRMTEYLNSEESIEEICNLSKKLDKLISKHCNC
ncbi:MAG: hypothetical protein M0P14_00940 [Alkaliphilus sp.]|nr:hypothetical protein [Alkaliphilus sp.]